MCLSLMDLGAAAHTFHLPCVHLFVIRLFFFVVFDRLLRRRGQCRALFVFASRVHIDVCTPLDVVAVCVCMYHLCSPTILSAHGDL